MSVRRALRCGAARLRDDAGFTLLEVLVAALIGTIVTGAAFSFLIFANEDASHITERVGVDQRARIALQRVVSELHSVCVAPGVVPIVEGSNSTVMKFVSEAGEEAALTAPELHELVFTAPSGSKLGTLVENTYKNTGGNAASYTWATTPASTTKVLNGVEETSYQTEKPTPVFRYYRYYQEGDAVPLEHTSVPYGEINPNALASVTSSTARLVVKVTLAFTVTPEGTEAISFNKDRPVPLEDSVVFRVASSSENASTLNLPCSQAV